MQGSRGFIPAALFASDRISPVDLSIHDDQFLRTYGPDDGDGQRVTVCPQAIEAALGQYCCMFAVANSQLVAIEIMNDADGTGNRVWMGSAAHRAGGTYTDEPVALVGANSFVTTNRCEPHPVIQDPP